MRQGHPVVHDVPGGRIHGGGGGHVVPVPGGHRGVVRGSTGGREEVEGVVQGELRHAEHQHHDAEAQSRSLAASLGRPPGVRMDTR